MTNTGYVPQRGDLAWLTLDPTLGHEQRGRRPVVVLSEGGYNGRTGLMVCCPVTNSVKGYPLEVPLPENVGVSGVALTDQIKSVDWRERRAEYISRLPAVAIAEVLRHARVMLSED
ncbi:MAG: type II toxin-antitoxin system PemK/MazF family toxin [Dehalococcoidia bacterium]